MTVTYRDLREAAAIAMIREHVSPTAFALARRAMIDKPHSAIGGEAESDGPPMGGPPTDPMRSHEVAPPKGEPLVKGLKKHSDITNPFALAWWMKGQHYGPWRPKHKHEAEGSARDGAGPAEREMLAPSFLKYKGKIAQFKKAKRYHGRGREAASRSAYRAAGLRQVEANAASSLGQLYRGAPQIENVMRFARQQQRQVRRLMRRHTQAVRQRVRQQQRQRQRVF